MRKTSPAQIQFPDFKPESDSDLPARVIVHLALKAGITVSARVTFQDISGSAGQELTLEAMVTLYFEPSPADSGVVYIGEIPIKPKLSGLAVLQVPIEVILRDLKQHIEQISSVFLLGCAIVEDLQIVLDRCDPSSEDSEFVVHLQSQRFAIDETMTLDSVVCRQLHEYIVEPTQTN